MALSESKAVQVLNAYINFCNELKRTRQITDKNFNRIRVINSCIGGQKENLRSTWGDLFDEIYKLLEKPEIKSRLDNENKEIQKLRIQKKSEKKSNQELKNSIISSSKIKLDIRSSKLKSGNSQKRKKGIITKINGEYIEEKNIRNTKKSGSSVGNEKKRKTKKTRQHIEEKSIQELREIFWRSVAQAKQDEQDRNIINKNRQIIQPIKKLKKSPPIYNFDDSSIFEDIMDEQRAEGKGYSGAK